MRTCSNKPHPHYVIRDDVTRKIIGVRCMELRHTFRYGKHMGQVRKKKPKVAKAVQAPEKKRHWLIRAIIYADSQIFA